MTRAAELATALAAVRARLDAAVAAAGRRQDDVQLLPVTKYFPASDVAILAGLGCAEVGESRDQEAGPKSAEVADLVDAPMRWHMVGNVQKNKARGIAGWASVVHSVGSARVAAALAKASSAAIEAGGRTGPLGAYVQISLDGDVARGGADVGRPDVVDEICALIDDAPGMQLLGVMGIPPLAWAAADAFARLEEEHRRVRIRHPDATGLSAGMSGDLEIAVKHGSTCVRVGTALLGPRPLPSP